MVFLIQKQILSEIRRGFILKPSEDTIKISKIILLRYPERNIIVIWRQFSQESHVDLFRIPVRIFSEMRR